MYRYEFLDHVADLKVRIIADTFEDIFKGIVSSYKEIICSKSRGHEIRTFELQFHNEEDLIFSFVSELIYLSDAERFIAQEIEVHRNNDNVYFVLKGKRLIEYKNYVKAITYHELRFEKKDNLFIVEFILDL